MATLNFSKQGDFYVAEATVNNDYNLHIEREQFGVFFMQQKFAGDDYGTCNLPSVISNGNWKAMDYTFSHGMYPMKVRFKSLSEVKKAEINEKKEG